MQNQGEIMPQVEKITISISREILHKIEEMRKETGESRSALIQRAMQKLLKEREKAGRVRRYVEGYRLQPETKEEIEAAELSASELLAREPWE